jgi:hypothetical protein
MGPQNEISQFQISWKPDQWFSICFVQPDGEPDMTKVLGECLQIFITNAPKMIVLVEVKICYYSFQFPKH